MTVEKAQELSRLAGLWATARVRRALVSHGCGARGETAESTIERHKKANEAFHQYLRSLISTNQDS